MKLTIFLSIFFIVGCQTPAPVSNQTKGFELSYRKGQIYHKCVVNILEDSRLELKSFRDEKLVKQGSFDGEKYSHILKDAAKFFHSVQNGKKMDAHPCRIPFQMSLTDQKGGEKLEGCLPNEESIEAGRLIEKIEFTLLSNS